MSGACVVSTRHHDWSRYIVDENGKSYAELYPDDGNDHPVFEGVNGIIVPDNPKSAANLIADLLTTRIKDARRIGKKGRETAIKDFHINRWMDDWSNFLGGIMQ